MKKNSSGFIEVLVLVLIFILVVTGIYFFSRKQAAPSLSPKSTTSLSPTADPTIINWMAYQNEEYGFIIRYPDNWRLEIPKQLSKNQFTFYLELKDSPIDRSINLTGYIMVGETAKYRFSTCCRDLEKERLGYQEFYKTDHLKIDGMIEWNFITGNENKLAEFLFGVGKRDDPPPPPNPEEVKKELNETLKILSTFKFLD